jgi:hypothetical protein
MRYFSFIVLVAFIIFFIPKSYTIDPGKVSKSSRDYFFKNEKKKCLGVDLGLEIKKPDGSIESMCAGWLSKKDYVDFAESITQ